MSEDEETRPGSFYKQRFFAFLALFLLFVVLIINTRFTGRPPQILSISPQIGEPGDVILIEGKYFGERELGNEVHIAGVTPASSEYLEWDDTKIRFMIPEGTSSGLVHVLNRNGTSNSEVFANVKQVPVVISGPSKPGEPYIQSVNPTDGSIGTLLTVTGINFGLKKLEKGGSGVFFTWISEGTSDSSLIAASMSDLDFESWVDREIKVRIPDGAVSGNMFVSTDKGKSNSVFIEVRGGGMRLFHSKRTYSVKYSVVIDNITAQTNNKLYIWIPQICDSPSQRNVQLILREPDPIFENVSGSMVFLFRELLPGEIYRISVNYIFDRYTMETKVNSSQINWFYKTRPTLYAKFTASDEYLPSDSQRLQQQARIIVRNERNPNRRARLIYNFIRARLSPTDDKNSVSLLDAIELKKGNAYAYALLFCTLTRAAGIPARPVAGYLVNDQKRSIKHFWAEFYITDTGWIPVDPFLGDDTELIALDQDVDHGSYYFGNLDNRHIAISKGIAVLNQMDSEGRTVRRAERADFQTIHEQVIGNLTTYRAVWSDLEILGVY